MTFLDLLRAHWDIWGLDAPKFAWLASAVLLLVPLCVLAFLYWKIRRQSSVLSEVAERLERLRLRISPDFVQSSQAGLPGGAYEALKDILRSSPTLVQAWNSYASTVVTRPAKCGEDRFWASEGAESSFTEAALWGGQLNRDFYNSLPGVVTSTGLLFTFLAILVALLDVRIDTQTNQIQGLPLLIEGLSGKFVSSIAALLAATIFLLAEKPLLHRLSKGRLHLISSIDVLMPRLSSTRVMAEMQRELGAMVDWASIAGKTSAEQLELSKTQVKASTAILRQFMIQMNETAGSSITHMAATLTGVVRDLSDKVNDLGAQMAATLQKSADQANTATSVVVEKVEKWSSRSAQQLDEVIAQLQSRADDVKEMEYQFASLNAALSEITGDVNVMSERLQELTDSLERLRGSADAKRA
jgi:hypothetical protein